MIFTAPWTVTDVIGCVITNEGKVFFTRNGGFIGFAPTSQHDRTQLHASITVFGEAEFEFKFAAPFRFTTTFTWSNITTNLSMVSMLCDNHRFIQFLEQFS